MNIRQAINNFPEPRVVAIALDTKGPEIRTGMLLDGKDIELKKGDRIRVTTEDSAKDSCTAVNLYVDYKNITKVVKPGSKVYVDDGLISLLVDEIGMQNFSIFYFRCFVVGRRNWNLSESNGLKISEDNTRFSFGKKAEKFRNL